MGQGTLQRASILFDELMQPFRSFKMSSPRGQVVQQIGAVPEINTSTGRRVKRIGCGRQRDDLIIRVKSDGSGFLSPIAAESHQ
jgi:hypothetical protein